LLPSFRGFLVLVEGIMRHVLTAVATILIAAAPAFAQWLKHPDPSLPRTPDGVADLSSAAPRTADGKPDLSGIWLSEPDPNGKPGGVENQIFPRYFVNIAEDLKPGEVPLRPAAAELLKERLASQGKTDPVAHCKPTGVPAIATIPLPSKIIQMPRLVLVLYEENTVFRQIFLDGRKLSDDPQPRWMGYSTGEWVGDTLVVETVGFNEHTWLDRMGHPHTANLRVTERFRRRDVGHLDIEVTIDDPGAYTKPITYTVKQALLPDDELFEYFCSENEVDVARFR
jgi:hypothetical protein